MRRFTGLVAAATAVVLNACARPPQGVPPPGPAPVAAADQLTAILQAGAGAEGWKLAGEAQHFAGEAIYDYMDGSGEIPVACGFREMVVGDWEHSGGTAVTVELYDMGSAANAFGLFSMKREPDGATAPLSHPACLLPGELVAWKGSTTMVLLCTDPAKCDDEAMIALATAFEGAIQGDAGQPPELLQRLPEPGRLADTVRYFHNKFALDTVWFETENVLHLSARTEVAAADYEAPKGRVVVVKYPAEGAAAESLEAWRQLLHAEPVPGSQGLLAKTEDGPLGAVAAGPYLGVVVEAADQATVTTLLQALATSLGSGTAPAGG